MNRYLMFAGSGYYPEGWNDFVCSSNCIDDLIAKVTYDRYNPDDDIKRIKKMPHKQAKLVARDEGMIADLEARRGEPINFSVGNGKVDWVEIVDLETESVCWTTSCIE